MKCFYLKESKIKVSPFNQFMNILSEEVSYDDLHIFKVNTGNKEYLVEYLEHYAGYTDKDGYNYKLVVLDVW